MSSGTPPRKNAPRRTKTGSDAPGIRLPPAERVAVYGARRFIGSGVEKTLRIRIPFDVYFQDPLVAAAHAHLAFDKECFVPWEE